MQIEFNEKTRELHITISVNPESTQPSSTGKTFILGSDRAKVELGKALASVQVNVTRPAAASKGKGKTK